MRARPGLNPEPIERNAKGITCTCSSAPAVLVVLAVVLALLSYPAYACGLLRVPLTIAIRHVTSIAHVAISTTVHAFLENLESEHDGQPVVGGNQW